MLKSLSKAFVLASTAGLLATGASTAAQNVTAPEQTAPAPKQVDEAKLTAAVSVFNVFLQALRSEEVKPEIKNRLYSCAYLNTFETISDEVDKLIAANASLDRSNDGHIYVALGLICGSTPEELGVNNQGAAAAAPAPEGAPR